MFDGKRRCWKFKIIQTHFPHQITPLHLACKNGYTNIVKLLLCDEDMGAKADISLKDIFNRNCLDYAIDNKHEYDIKPNEAKDSNDFF